MMAGLPEHLKEKDSKRPCMGAAPEGEARL